jgi:hypothetical protein
VRNPTIADALIVLGAGGLLSSLTGRWFFVVPVATYNNESVWGYDAGATKIMPDYSDIGNFLRVWAFIVFNLTETESGVLGMPSTTYGLYAAPPWADWKWGDPVPASLGGGSSQTAYGPLGPSFGFVSLGVFAVGGALRLLVA